MKCPFCSKGDINIIHIPVSLSFKKGPYGGGKAGITSTAEKTRVEEEKCSNCGKLRKEIEKALETGITKELSHEDRLKRLKDSGLPLILEGKRQE